MGFNTCIIGDSPDGNMYPAVRHFKVPLAKQVSTPPYLQEHLEGCAISQIMEVELNSKDVIRPGSFVVVSVSHM
jgi:hypothetical protein